jgi:hypothetical protein
VSRVRSRLGRYRMLVWISDTQAFCGVPCYGLPSLTIRGPSMIGRRDTPVDADGKLQIADCRLRIPSCMLLQGRTFPGTVSGTPVQIASQPATQPTPIGAVVSAASWSAHILVADDYLHLEQWQLSQQLPRSRSSGHDA